MWKINHRLWVLSMAPKSRHRHSWRMNNERFIVILMEMIRWIMAECEGCRLAKAGWGWTLQALCGVGWSGWLWRLAHEENIKQTCRNHTSNNPNTCSTKWLREWKPVSWSNNVEMNEGCAPNQACLVNLSWHWFDLFLHLPLSISLYVSSTKKIIWSIIDTSVPLFFHSLL